MVYIQDLRLLSIATHGTYRDEYEGINPDIIDQYYGIHGRELNRWPGQTGAGHSDDEDGSRSGGHDVTRIQVQILDKEHQHVHHDAVKVPEQLFPFNSVQDEAIFFGILETIITEGIIPEGYGCLPGELDDEDAEMVEVLELGRWRKKSITIALTEPIWTARTKLWAQASDLLAIFDAAGHCPSK